MIATCLWNNILALSYGTFTCTNQPPKSRVRTSAKRYKTPNTQLHSTETGKCTLLFTSVFFVLLSVIYKWQGLKCRILNFLSYGLFPYVRVKNKNNTLQGQDRSPLGKASNAVNSFTNRSRLFSIFIYDTE